MDHRHILRWILQSFFVLLALLCLIGCQDKGVPGMEHHGTVESATLPDGTATQPEQRTEAPTELATAGIAEEQETELTEAQPTESGGRPDSDHEETTIGDASTAASTETFTASSEPTQAEVQAPTVGIRSFCYGRSESGRDLMCYEFCGDDFNRTVLLNFAIHGYEDEYDADGQVLVDLAEELIDHYSEVNELHGCRLLIVPCANPDGLYDGYTNNGFGRCNARGIDLNRDFDANYTPYASARYYTPYAFSAAESRALRDLCLEYAPDVVIDFHGWLDYTIGDSALAEVFAQEMGLSHYVDFTGSNCSGYFANWAHQNGALSLLVEFTSSTRVDREDLFSAVDRLVRGSYSGGDSNTYALSSTYGQFTQVQGYATSDQRVTTYAAVDTPFNYTSYIDGANDLCTIQKIYENGWVKVSYPVASGNKTAYCYLSDFFDVENAVVMYKAQVSEAATVYAKQDMQKSIGSVWSNDEFYVIADNGTALQIIYSLDSGGWKLGWIHKTNLS